MKNSSQASVLIVVMVLCFGLVAITLLFGYRMMIARRAADNNLAAQQAEQALEGGARYGVYLMTNVARPGAMPDANTLESGSLEVGDATFWFIGVPQGRDFSGEPTFGIVDEASKLNINTASVEMLMGLPGMTSELATNIVAWRSAATGTDNAGVILSSSNAKFAPFETPEELILLTGTDTTLLYGRDLNLNHVLDPVESESDSRNEAFGLLEYVTVFSREPNVQSDGATPRVLVTGSTPALTALLTNAFGARRAGELIRRAQTSGTVNSVLGFYIRSGMTEPEFEEVAPRLTAATGSSIAGLVNANTASATVLACLPGIDPDNAAALVAARGQTSTQPATLAWVVPILGEENALLAGPYLTADSYQWSVDVAAVGRHGRGYRRALFILDNLSGTPRILYRRNLSHLGWALGDTVRESLLSQKND